MVRWLSSFGADLKAVFAAWRASRGGWPDLSALLSGRQLAIETAAPLAGRTQTVLRTRLRITADSETEVLALWLDVAHREEIEALAAAHFRSVAAAGAGMGAAVAMARVVRDLLVAVPLLSTTAFLADDVWRVGWQSLGWVLITDRGILGAIGAAGLGLVFRRLFRTWLRSRLAAYLY